MTSRKPYKSKEFLQWAKRQTGPCCICGEKPGAELHHFGPSGMGQKGSDLLVARVCHECHLGKNAIQGKRRIGFERIERLDMWCDILTDCMALMHAYIEQLDQSNH